MSHYQDLVKQSQALLSQFQAERKQLNAEQLSIKYLGKKGLFNELAGQIKNLKRSEDKKRIWPNTESIKKKTWKQPWQTVKNNKNWSMSA